MGYLLLGAWAALPAPCWRQRSEQNFTPSQSRSHFLRQVNGRPQQAHSLLGRFCFFCMRMGVLKSPG